MTGNMYGADSEELERIAAEIEGYEKELDYLLVQGVGAVSLVGLSATLGTIWRGPRSDEFGAMWQSRHLLRLRDVQGLLREAAKDLRKNAGEQRSASSISGPLPGRRGPNIGSPLEIDLRLLSPFVPGIGLMPLFPGYPGGGLPWQTGPSWDGLRSAWKEVRNRVDYADLAIGIARDGGDFAGEVFLHPHRWTTYGNLFEHADDFQMFDKISTGVGFIGVGLDGLETYQSWRDEGWTWGTGWKAVETGWSAAGVAFPPAGWAKTAFDTGVWIGDTAYQHTPLGDYLESSHPATASIDMSMDYGIQADQMVAAGQFDRANELNRQAMDAAKEARRQSEGALGLFNATKTVLSFGLL